MASAAWYLTDEATLIAGGNMEIELRPLRGAGPIEIGMPIDEAEGALQALPGFQSSGSTLFPVRGFAHYSSGLSISAAPGPGGVVQAVEIHRPQDDDVVRYSGVDVFARPAHDLIEWLRGQEEIRIEEGGHAVIVPSLALSFWRSVMPEGEDDENGRYFETVLVAESGYFDLP